MESPWSNKMNITINDNKCWVCGTDKNTTAHHAIPQHLKPKQNILIPICRNCHDKVHYDDVTGMYSYLHKIEKTFSDGERSIGVLKKMLGENTKVKQDLDKLMKKGKVNLSGKK